MPRTRNILAATAVAAFGAAAAYYWREKQTSQPHYTVLRRDKPFELRDYPPLLVASVEAEGERQRALESGFRRLADYIFAKEREGKEIAMTAPVLQDRDHGETAWRTRFVMPEGESEASLPTPPHGVYLEELVARRLAAVRFSGGTDMDRLQRQEDALRRWLEREELQPIGGFEYAFYNSPMIPPFLRRNEVLVPVAA